MTSITAGLEQLSEGDLRELVLKLASRDKSKTLLASAHQTARAILKRNRAEGPAQEKEKDRAQQQQQQQQQQPGARYMWLQLSTPQPRVASLAYNDPAELLLAKGDDGDDGAGGALEQYRSSQDGKFVYHTGEAIFFPDSINADGSVTGRYNWTCCGFDGRREPGLRLDRRRPA